MSPYSNFDDDDLPEFIKEMIKNFSEQFKSMNPNDLTDIFKKLNEMDPEEVENMMKKFFGNDFVEKLGSIGESIFGNLPNDFDPSIFNNIKHASINFDGTSKPKINYNEVIDEEAYFEIVDKENGLEIVVDLPGITDSRYVNWEVIEGKLKLSAFSPGIKYRATIDLPENVSIEGHLTRLKNSIFIIPMRKL